MRMNVLCFVHTEHTLKYQLFKTFECCWLVENLLWHFSNSESITRRFSFLGI